MKFALPVSAVRTTLRYVKVIRETVTKKVKKQGVETLKKSKIEVILNFDSVNLIFVWIEAVLL